jgi:hypothetical protein
MRDTKSNTPPCHPFCVTGTLGSPQLSTDRCKQGAELSRDLHSSSTRSGVDSDAMVFVTQLVYVHPGKESVFDEFEAVAIPLIAKHGGELLLRLRPTPESVIERSIELPYEISRRGRTALLPDTSRVRIWQRWRSRTGSSLIASMRFCAPTSSTHWRFETTPSTRSFETALSSCWMSSSTPSANR